MVSPLENCAHTFIYIGFAGNCLDSGLGKFGLRKLTIGPFKMGIQLEIVFFDHFIISAAATSTRSQLVTQSIDDAVARSSLMRIVTITQYNSFTILIYMFVGFA